MGLAYLQRRNPKSLLIRRGGASAAASGGRMGGGLVCWGGEPHNSKYKIANSEVYNFPNKI